MTLKDIQKHCTNNKAEGILCVAEDNTDVVPFEIKRVYYTYETDKEIIRGHHAHKKLEQLLICVYGEIEIQLDNGNGETETVILNDPSKGLYVGPMMWHTMKWLKNDSILLVLASAHYNEADYIRNYDEFKNIIKEKQFR